MGNLLARSARRRFPCLLLAAVALCHYGAVWAGGERKPPVKAEADESAHRSAGKGQASRPPAAKAATKAAQKKAATWDVKDTHERLARIYTKLGIKREQVKKPKEREGCDCDRGFDSPMPASSGASAPDLGFLNVILVVLLIAVVLVPIILLVRSAFCGNKDPKQTADVEVETSIVDGAADPAAPWRVDLSLCRELLRQGHVAAAYAALHRLTLVALERGQKLRLDETTTNWEYVRRLSSHPTLRDMLAKVTRAAEDGVLGQRPPGPEQYAGLEALVLERINGGPWR